MIQESTIHLWSSLSIVTEKWQQRKCFPVESWVIGLNFCHVLALGICLLSSYLPTRREINILAMGRTEGGKKTQTIKQTQKTWGNSIKSYKYQRQEVEIILAPACIRHERFCNMLILGTPLRIQKYLLTSGTSVFTPLLVTFFLTQQFLFVCCFLTTSSIRW